MMDVKKIIAKSKKYIHGDLLGEHNSKIIGDGYDFAKIRPYEYGEHIRRVDPFATAKSGELFLRTFYESREINIEVVALMSATLHFGSKVLKQTALATLAYDIGISSLKNSDRFGLSLFSNNLNYRLNGTKKEGKILDGIEKILNFKTLKSVVNYDNLHHYLISGINKRSYVFLIGDFFDIPKLKGVGKKHEVIVIKLRDRFELNPQPIGKVGVIDPLTLKKDTFIFNSNFVETYKKDLKLHDLKLKEYLKGCGIRMIEWKI